MRLGSRFLSPHWDLTLVLSTVPPQDLVLGDMVVLESGQRIPADLRILSSDGVKVSTYYGES